MNGIPDTNDINKLAAWFDKDTLELIGHILNKHTKACLSQMKELVIERKELKKRLAAAESDKLRLRGQLQHCVQKLSRVNRGARDRNEYTDIIDSANRAIYEIFECPQQEASGKGEL